MDIKYLTDDEILVECEVRGLSDASKKVTTALRNSLTDKWDAEKQQALGAPLKAHSAARKQPRREAKSCATKLEEIKQQILAQDTTEDVTDEVLKAMDTKLRHTHGRLVRISNSRAIKEEITGFFSTHQALVMLLKDLKTKKATLEAVIPEVMKINVPDVDVLEEDNRRGTSRTQPWNTSAARKDSHPTQEPGTSGMVTEQWFMEAGDNHEDGEASLVASLRGLKVELEEQLQIYDEGQENRRGSTSSRARQVSESSEGADEIADLGTLALPLDSKVCKDPSTWNLKFEGVRSSTHVERFFYRVERMAVRSKIPLNSLVDYMSLLLVGEALEWYWTYLERHQRGTVTWVLLKREMILRFQASRSDDDVRRALSQRKQMYPKESFLDFHDAILKLALQAKKAVTDQEIYNILRRNMRPGLQLELFENKSFPSVAQFVQKCVSLEDLWRRFGVNPESKLSVPQHGYNHNPGYNNQHHNRYQPRVHEVILPPENKMVYLDEEDDRYSDEEPEDYRKQICAMANHHKPGPSQGYKPQPQVGNKPNSEHRPPHGNGGRPPITRIEGRQDGNRNDRDYKPPTCWNCSDDGHTFLDCRTPVKHVFCYGCGAGGIYRPDCTRCNPKSENWRAGPRNRVAQPIYNARQQQPPPQNKATEEAASNTDPEFYRRR